MTVSSYGCAVPSLARKWKKAVDGVISSTNELNDLETTASDTKLAEWRSAAENAQTRRHQEISAMDIYNVQFDKGERSITSMLSVV